MITTRLSQDTISLLEEVPTTTVAEVAILLRPPLIKNEPEAQRNPEAKTYGVASITDFPESGYLGEIERHITVSEQQSTAEKYRIQPNDVLVSIVGSIGRVAVVPPDFDQNAVPSSNIVIIRMHNGDSHTAILAAMYYKSELGQSILQDLTHGKTIPLISKKAFAATPFPAINDDSIQAALSLYEQEIIAERQCRKMYEDIRSARKNFLRVSNSSTDN